MKGFILAAGYGKRLFPLTGEMPKSLIPVLNVPSIAYGVFLLIEAGITDIICNIHSHAEKMVSFFDKNRHFGVRCTLSVEEEILGTGGGVKAAESWAGNEPFILINSDVILDIRLENLIMHHLSSGCESTLLLHETPKASVLGDVGIENGKVVDFNNRLGSGVRSGFVYTGAAVLNPSVFSHIPRGASDIVSTAFFQMARDRKLGFLVHSGFWSDIGSMTSYWETGILHGRRVLGLGGRMEKVLGMHPCAHQTPFHAGSGSRIIRSVVGRGTHIGSGAVLRRSVILPGSQILPGAVIEDSVVYGGNVYPVHGEEKGERHGRSGP